MGTLVGRSGKQVQHISLSPVSQLRSPGARRRTPAPVLYSQALLEFDLVWSMLRSSAQNNDLGSESCHRRTLVSISLPVVCEHACPGFYHLVMISRLLC